MNTMIYDHNYTPISLLQVTLYPHNMSPSQLHNLFFYLDNTPSLISLTNMY